MALNTTGEKSGMRCVTRAKETRRRTLNLLGVGSASIVGIDLFRRGALVEGNKPLQKVVASGIVVITTVVIREVISQRRPREFLHEQVNLVQEQDLMET